MHIPSSMLHGAVCPVTAAVTVAGVGLSFYFVRKMKDHPSAFKFAAVTALVFALQMLNFPVHNGTSGHLLGGVLAVALLGVPYAVLGMAVVLTVQAVFFGDGGVSVLGANVLNMGLVGAGLVGILLTQLRKKGIDGLLAMGVAAWVSVVAASAACSFEVGVSGTVSMAKVLPAMVSVHALIGVGEVILTLAFVSVLEGYRVALKANEKMVAYAAFGLAVAAAALSPFASSFPDGLEKVAEQLSFGHFPAVSFPTLFNEYTVLTGMAGVVLVFLISGLLRRALMIKY